MISLIFERMKIFKFFISINQIIAVLFLTLSILVFNDLKAQNSNKVIASYEKQKDGILFQLNKQNNTDPQLLRIKIYSENIFRITASPEKTFSARKSLMIDKENWEPVEWKMNETDDFIEITTSNITARVNQVTGQIYFYNSKSELILSEKSNGKIISEADVLGESTYHIQQIFDSPDDEAFYGLGAHQNGIMNYKNHDVDLWQYNIIDIVPFLISNKNYGILWDNNSRTKFGDIRDYQSISGLKLYNKNGELGGLTAEYFRDRNFDSLYTNRTEKRIEHEFIDVNDPYPNGFAENVSAIRWTGEIECNEEGANKFKLYCSGYTKLWVDDKLIVDSWRQNWLPWNHFFKIDMQPGKKHKIKIEWIHSNGYIGLKYLTPEDPLYKESLSLYSEVADQIDYYFIQGNNFDEIISSYRNLTGKAPMMPKWALGLWQSRERYKTQQEVLSVVEEFRRRKIPFDNIVQDWHYWEEDKWGDHDFDPERFPDPKGMVERLHKEFNTKIMISVWPKFYVGTNNYKYFKDKGWLYMRNVEKGQRDWVGPGYLSTFYDPYNSEAREFYWKTIDEKLFSLGIDAWWLDSVEPDLQSNLSRKETILRMGPTALGSASRYLNTFSIVNCKAVYEGQRKSDPDKRVFILTRSSFAGQQRYAAATWSGDIATRWYDFKMQIPAGLNFALSGIPYWTTDIGGFGTEPRYEYPNEKDLEEWRELNTRWFQFGVFCPLLRVHGQFPYREMFNIAPDDHPAYQAMLKYDKLRYRLMPFIYSLAGMVTLNNYTIMRPLIMDFAEDKNITEIGNQFMFGPAFLINPVTEYKARERDLYLPAGTGWYEFETGKYFEGGKNIIADAPYSDIPIYIKEGSIIPFGPELQFTDEKPADLIRLFIYTGKDAVFNLYEDEGTNNNYEKGSYSIIPFIYNETSKTLTIGKRSGEFEGMLNERTFEIVWISKNDNKPVDFNMKPDKILLYNGAEISVKME